MPYGVKRGFKSPGEFSAFDLMGLGLSGSAGIVAALVTDYQQSAEGAAIYTLNRWAVSLGSLLGFNEIPLFAVVLGIVAIGATSIFYFQPITRQGAFAQGFGLLAVLMTAIPDDLAMGIEDIINDPNLPGLLSPAASNGEGVTEISFETGQTANNLNGDKSIDNFATGLPDQSPQAIGGIIPAAVLQKAVFSEAEVPLQDASSQDASGVQPAAFTQAATVPAQYQIKLHVTFEGGFPNNIGTLIRRGKLRGRLHNEDTGETFNLFRNAGGILRKNDNVITIEAGVPARSRTAKLWVRIECDDHSIELQSAQATVGKPLVWPMTVKASKTPIFLQRLRRVYWF